MGNSRVTGLQSGIKVYDLRNKDGDEDEFSGFDKESERVKDAKAYKRATKKSASDDDEDHVDGDKIVITGDGFVVGGNDVVRGMVFNMSNKKK